MILFVNGWSDDNKGDAAIVVGSMSALAGKVARAECGLVSLLALSTEDRRWHQRHTATYFGQGVFAPLIEMNERLHQSRMRRAGRRLFELGRSVLLLVAGPAFVRMVFPFLFSRPQLETLRAYERSSLVISKGGHFLLSVGGLRGALGLYCNAFPLLLGRRAGARTMIYGQSIGPVKDAVGRRLLTAVLYGCDRVLVRETKSLALVERLAPKLGTRLGLCLDPAFETPVEELPKEVVQRLPKVFAAVTVRQWQFVEQERPGDAGRSYEGYLLAMAAVVRFLKQECGLEVVLVAQVCGPTALENDFVAWNDLKHRMPESVWPLEVREDLTPGQLRALYGRARITVGTRFHSVILSLSAGTPSLAVSYFGTKATGIMEDLGLAEYAVDIAEVRGEALKERVRRLLAEESDVRERIQEEIARSSRASEFVVTEAMSYVGRAAVHPTKAQIQS